MPARKRPLNKEPVLDNAQKEEVHVPKRQRAARTAPDLPVIPKSEGKLSATLFVFGQGDSGQLGLGELISEDDDLDEDDPSEVKLPRISNVAKGETVQFVAAGGMHSVAVTSNGEVYTAGVNDEGALGRKTENPIWEGRESAAASGDSYSWGRVDVPKEYGSVVAVSAGDSHTAALTADGAVYAWGTFRGSSGPYGFTLTSDTEKIALLPKLVWTPYRQAEQIVKICSGADHVLALRHDGQVLSWGFGEQGQLGRLAPRMRDPAGTMLQPALVPLHRIAGVKRGFKAKDVAAGSFSSFVLGANGQVLAFGVNQGGQLGLPIQEGNVEGNSIPRPVLVDTLTERVAAVGAGKTHSLALLEDGSVQSFGTQTYGRLGREDADIHSDGALPPGPVSNLAGVVATDVIAGHDTSALVDNEGQAFFWGMGTNFQLGKASDRDERLPGRFKIESLGGKYQRIVQVSFGGQHTLLLAE